VPRLLRALLALARTCRGGCAQDPRWARARAGARNRTEGSAGSRSGDGRKVDAAAPEVGHGALCCQRVPHAHLDEGLFRNGARAELEDIIVLVHVAPDFAFRLA